MTEEHKRKIQEARKKSAEEKKALGLPVRVSRKKKGRYVDNKPVLVVTGLEKDMFDFWKLLRSTLRPMKLNLLCHKLEKEIQSPIYWQNPHWMVEVLSKHLYIEYIKVEEKKKTRKKKV